MSLRRALQTASVAALGAVTLSGSPAPSASVAQAAEANAAGPRMNLMPIVPGKAYWFDSSSNAGFVIGETGVIVIDTSPNEISAALMLEKIREITPKPVKYLIETHSDCDHINGAMAFPRGTTIIAHENNDFEQRQILRLITVEIDGGHGFQHPDWLPTKVVNGDRLDTKIDGVKVSFLHPAPAHTSGDLMIYFPEIKAVFAGDILMGAVPRQLGQYNRSIWFKYEKGGSIAGWQKTMDVLLKLDATIFVPGHGVTVFTKADIRDFADGVGAEKKRIDAMADSGKSLAEISDAFDDHHYPPRGVKIQKGRVPPGKVDCPRGIEYPAFTWLEYQEWLKRNAALK